MAAWVDVVRFGWGYFISDQCGSFPPMSTERGLTRGKPELLTGRTMRERPAVSSSCSSGVKDSASLLCDFFKTQNILRFLLHLANILHSNQNHLIGNNTTLISISVH